MALKATVQKQSNQSLPKVSSEAFFKIDFLKNFAAEKYLCWSLLLKKVSGLKAGNFIKKRLQQRCFPVNIATFLITVFL